VTLSYEMKYTDSSGVVSIHVKNWLNSDITQMILHHYYNE
jgi:hypothetical protein